MLLDRVCRVEASPDAEGLAVLEATGTTPPAIGI
jgi:hypothetical protein